MRLAVAEVERSLEPAETAVVAGLLAETLLIFGTPPNWDKTAKFYLEALEDVPGDLVRSALREVRLTSKFFPKPAELRKPIGEEFARRKAAASLLKAALQSKLREGDAAPRSDEPRVISAATQQILDDLKARFPSHRKRA